MTKAETLIVKLWQRKAILFAFLVFVIIGACLFTELYYPSIHLNKNQKMWKKDRPSTYFMQVRQRENHGWIHWKAIISDEVVLQATAEAQTADQIFSRLESDCVPRGFMDCGITFNQQFHYPATAHSYEGYYIEIEEFFPCDNDITECLSAMETQ